MRIAATYSLCVVALIAAGRAVCYANDIGDEYIRIAKEWEVVEEELTDELEDRAIFEGSEEEQLNKLRKARKTAFATIHGITEEQLDDARRMLVESRQDAVARKRKTRTYRFWLFIVMLLGNSPLFLIFAWALYGDWGTFRESLGRVRAMPRTAERYISRFRLYILFMSCLITLTLEWFYVLPFFWPGLFEE